MNREYLRTVPNKVYCSKEQYLRQSALLKKKHKQRVAKNRKKTAIFFIFATVLMYIVFLFNNHLKSFATEKTSLSSPKVVSEEREIPEKKSKTKKEINTEPKSMPTKTVPKNKETTITKKVQPTKESQTQKKYNPNIPMPQEHQEYLYKLCKERGLDFIKTLAIIKHESKFNPNSINPKTQDYGYFQINIVNHKDLSQKLHTENNPLNPYVNINWGTYKLAELYHYWREKGYEGDRLDEAVWSSYNKGIRGFLKHGHAVKYVQKVRESIKEIQKMMA
jgi:hypothetical protein